MDTNFYFEEDEADEAAMAPFKAKVASSLRAGQDEAKTLVPPITVTDVTVENFARIKRATMNLNKTGITSLGGMNANGKSSVLIGFKAVVGGKSYIPDQPVHFDEPFATLVCHIQDDSGKVYHVKRTIKSDRSCNTVITRLDGTVVDKGQEFFDWLAGKNWRNPLAFMSADDNEIVRMTKEWMGLDLTPLDTQEKSLFERRTEIGRERDRLKGLYEKLPFYEGAPAEEKTPVELKVEWDAAVAHNAKMEARRSKLQKADNQLAGMKTEPESIRAIAMAEAKRIESENVSIRKQIETLQATLEDNLVLLPIIATKCNEDCTEADANIAKFEAQIAKYKSDWGDLTDKDTTSIAEQMTDVEEGNKKVRANQQRKQAYADYKVEDAAYDVETNNIESVRAERKRTIVEAMAKHKDILPDLHFDDAGANLMYGDVLFNRASTAERLKVAVIMSFVMNVGGIKICLVDDGEKLDKTSLHLLDEIGKKLGVQIFLARVTDEYAEECTYVVCDGVVGKPKKREAK